MMFNEYYLKTNLKDILEFGGPVTEAKPRRLLRQSIWEVMDAFITVIVVRRVVWA